MLSESVFRSEELPAADRFDAWRACMDQAHAPMDLSSDHAADFRSHLRLIRFGAIKVWPATFQQLVFHRTTRLIRQSDPEVYHLSLLLHGEAKVSFGRQQAAYRAYDYHSSDSARPYEIWTGQGPITSVGVEVPKALLPLPRNKADQAIGRPMSGREGIGALLAQFLTQVTADTGSYQPTDGPRLGTILNDLVSALFAHTLDVDNSLPPETRSRTLTLRIKSFIRRQLHDPELTPGSVAAAHHISRSYLYRLFQAEGTTVASYIRRQRLEGARHDLVNPALATTPIHVIAARWGFPRAADFSRAFRTAYDTPPIEHRHQAIQPKTAR
jgi:AraC-like DNA-binding protein